MEKLLFIIFLFVILLSHTKRSTRYAFYAFLGLTALIVAGATVVNVNSFVDWDKIKNIHDFISAVRFEGLLVLVCVIFLVAGWFIVRKSIRGFINQKRFERNVDRFHDAWSSRKDRW